MDCFNFVLFNCSIGEIGVVYDSDCFIVKQILLPDMITKKVDLSRIRFNVCRDNPDKFIRGVVSKIRDIVSGRRVDFSLDCLDLSYLTSFQRSVLLKQYEVPYSRVVSYRDLACMINRPASVRPLANALSCNPFALVIACHRTVRSDYSLGGYAGYADNPLKRVLLENEGVSIVDGRVCPEFRYNFSKKS